MKLAFSVPNNKNHASFFGYKERHIWSVSSPLFDHRARPRPLSNKNEYMVLVPVKGNCNPGSSHFYYLIVSQAQKCQGVGR